MLSLHRRPDAPKELIVSNCLVALARLGHDSHSVTVLKRSCGPGTHLIRQCVVDGALEVRRVVVFALNDDHILQPTGHVKLAVNQLAQVASVEPLADLALEGILKRVICELGLPPVATGDER